MTINDFYGCTTAVVQCTEQGTVRALNPAARGRFRQLYQGKKLTLHAGITQFPFGRCLCIPDGGSVWLLFCDFLSFKSAPVLFPTAEEAMALSSKDFLLLIAACGHYAQNAQDAVRLSRIRALLYDRFSFVFSTPGDPTSFYRPQTFFLSYQTAAARGYGGIGAHLRFDISALRSDRYINARNATTLITSVCSALLFHTRDARVRIRAYDAGDTVCVSFTAVLAQSLPPVTGERDILTLAPYFPEYAIDLCAAQICVQTCDYAIEYSVDQTGRIDLSLYLKCETVLGDLLDRALEVDPTDEIAALIACFSARRKQADNQMHND